MSLKGMSDAGPTTAAADAPLANDKETPTTLRRYDFLPTLSRRSLLCLWHTGVLQAHVAGLRVGFGQARGKAKPLAGSVDY